MNGKVRVKDIVEQNRGSEKQLESEVKRLKHIITSRLEFRNYVITPSNNATTLTFGLLGDTQFGSIYERIDALKEFYSLCYREGIRDVLHSGDVLDGWNVYKGQAFELYARGFDEQLEVFKKKAPYFKDMKTTFITGNHDGSYKKDCGITVGPRLEDARNDWKYIGADYGRIKMVTKSGRTCIIDLVHPGGGTAYAISYHLQKYIEAISGGTKPDIVGIGHYHKAEMLPSHRNVVGIQTGTFQSQTPFMRNRRLAAHIGGWIIQITPGSRDHLTQRIKSEFISFYEPEGR